MAALLYLPRLFVYHTMNIDKPEVYKVLSLMEKKLIKIIMNPAMVLSVASGIFLLYLDMSYLNFWWMHLKLLCVLFMIIVHRYFIYLHQLFIADKNQKDHLFFRKINEIPTVLMIIIVFLIVLKS